MITGINNLNKSTASNFELYFPKVPVGTTIRDTKSLTLNIFETVIPTMSLDVADVHWQGGVAHQDVGSLTYENWMVNFSVDSKFYNWYILHRWITFINNNKDQYGRNPRDYKVDAVMRVLDNYRNEVMVMSITGMWLNMLGEVRLTYREGGINLSSSANFIYERYEIRNILEEN